MSIIDTLAISLGRRDEVPNKELAGEIVRRNDRKAVEELIAALHGKDKNIQSDCIKVLYEIAEQKPTLIARHVRTFIELLENKNNRLIWGAMTAIDAVTSDQHAAVYGALATLINAADTGSVITRDHLVNILIKLSSLKQYAKKTFPVLITQLKTCPLNQLPMYAERALPAMSGKNTVAFVKVLTSRLDEIEKESGRKRIETVLKRTQIIAN